MSKIKKQVTLNEETIEALEHEGIGSLSMGIELVFREWKRGTVTPARKEKTLDLPDEDDEPKMHKGTASKLARLAAEDADKKKTAYDAPRTEFKVSCRSICDNPSAAGWFPALMDKYQGTIPTAEMLAIMAEVRQDMDESIARDRAAWIASHKAREQAEAKFQARKTVYMDEGLTEAEAVHCIKMEDGTGQTLKLSPEALKALNITETPDAFTDEQIADINATYALSPEQRHALLDTTQAPKHEPTLSELWAANPLIVPEDN